MLKRLVILAICFLSVFEYSYAQQEKIVNFQTINQQANSLLYDSFNSKILITVPSSDVVHGNSIGIVDPISTVLTNNYFVGSDPAPMAMTSDGKYVYVGLLGASLVQRFNLNTHLNDLTINLGSSSFLGPKFANSISCRPGSDTIISVAESYVGVSPGEAGLYIFHNNQQMPDSVDGTFHPIDEAYFYDSTKLFGYNSQTSSFDFYYVNVNSIGATAVSDAQMLFSGFGNNFFYAGHYAVSYTGSVADITGNPSLMATFSFHQMAFGSISACYDPYMNLACFAYPNAGSDTVYIDRFNMTNFLQQDELVVPIQTTGVHNLINWGDSTKLAFSTAEGKIVIINGFGNCANISQGYYGIYQSNNGVTFIDTSKGVNSLATYSWSLNGFPVSDSASFTYYLLTTSQDYTICETINEPGCYPSGPLCEEFLFTGIQNINAAENLKFYPNPANTEITIDANNALIKQVEVYNNMGQKVIDTDGHLQMKVTVDLSTVQAGFYFMTIQLDNNESIRKSFLVDH